MWVWHLLIFFKSLSVSVGFIVDIWSFQMKCYFMQGYLILTSLLLFFYMAILTHWGRDKMDAISQTTFFKCIFLNENVWIPIKISLKFVPKGPINNIPALVQIMAWRRPGDKPLSETVMVRLLTHICVTRPQWVKKAILIFFFVSKSIPSCDSKSNL